MCADLSGQTKKDPVTLTTFSVNKTGKAIVKYSYFESPGVKYKVETQKPNVSWTVLNEFSQYPMVAKDNSKIINKTDTFTVHLDKSMKQIRILFLEPKSNSLVTKTIAIH